MTVVVKGNEKSKSVVETQFLFETYGVKQQESATCELSEEDMYFLYFALCNRDAAELPVSTELPSFPWESATLVRSKKEELMAQKRKVYGHWFETLVTHTSTGATSIAAIPVRDQYLSQQGFGSDQVLVHPLRQLLGALLSSEGTAVGNRAEQRNPWERSTVHDLRQMIGSNGRSRFTPGEWHGLPLGTSYVVSVNGV